jgi:lipocalin
VGGPSDNNPGSAIGAAWVYTRSGGVWTQQGSKLVGTGNVGPAGQGRAVALSSDGNTAIVGGPDSDAGAAWVYTRSGNVWTQQGSKLVGTGVLGGQALQGISVALSADGNTAILGGPFDNNDTGAAWVFTRSNGVWTQQGGKLVGTGAVVAEQGISVALSADGNTAIVGGPLDNNDTGAAWVYTRSGGVWTQQGSKLVGTGAAGNAWQGISVALSGDSNTAIVGGPSDNNPGSAIGAAWVYTRSGGVWTQQGSKLVGTGNVGPAGQGRAVALSSDGNTAIVGGSADNNETGAAWVYTRSGNVWTQQGGKLVGADAAGHAHQYSVSLSADGNTTIVGGPGDNSNTGAAWVFVQPLSLQVTPTTNIVAAGNPGGPFAPSSFHFQLSATAGSIDYSISGFPNWLTPSSTSGTASTGTTVTFTVNATANSLAAGTYGPTTVTFTNSDTGRGTTTVTATLTVNPPALLVTPATQHCRIRPAWRSILAFIVPLTFDVDGQESSEV